MLTVAELKERIYERARRARPEPRVYTWEEAVDAIANAARGGYAVCAPLPFGTGIRAMLAERGLEIVDNVANQAAVAAGQVGRAVLVAQGVRFRVLADGAGAAAVGVFFGALQDREVVQYLAEHGYGLTAEEMARAGGFAAVFLRQGQAERYSLPDLFFLTRDVRAAEIVAAVLAPEPGYFAARERQALAEALLGARGWSEVLGRLEEAASRAAGDPLAERAAAGALVRIRAAVC